MESEACCSGKVRSEARQGASGVRRQRARLPVEPGSGCQRADVARPLGTCCHCCLARQVPLTVEAIETAGSVRMSSQGRDDTKPL